MEEDKAWFDSGWDASMEGEKSGSSANNLRFWLKKGASARLIFLTAVPSCVLWEHSPKIDGSFKFSTTCPKMLKQSCELCDAGVYRYRAAFFTVIDTTVWVDKKGKSHEFTKRLFVAKQSTWEKLQRQHKRREEKGQSLRGSLYTVTRGTSDTAPAVGEDFEFEEMIELGDLPVDLQTEFDYVKLLKPDAEQVKSLAKRVTAGLAADRAAAPGPVKY